MEDICLRARAHGVKIGEREITKLDRESEENRGDANVYEPCRDALHWQSPSRSGQLLANRRRREVHREPWQNWNDVCPRALRERTDDEVFDDPKSHVVGMPADNDCPA